MIVSSFAFTEKTQMSGCVWRAQLHLQIFCVGFLSPDRYLSSPGSEQLMESFSLQTRLVVSAPRASCRKMLLGNQTTKGKALPACLVPEGLDHWVGTRHGVPK